MEDKTKGYFSLRQVVLSCQNERGDYTKVDYKRMLQFAIDGYRKFSMHHIPCVRKVWLPIDPLIYSVDYPDDLIKMLSVGIPIDGRYWEFSKIVDRIIPQCQTPNSDRQESDQRIEVPIENYGMRGGFNRFNYQEDLPNRRLIIFGPSIDEVLLYYKSTGIKADGTTEIPVHAFDALKAYVHYKIVKFSNTSDVKIQMYKNDYLGEVKDMRDFENSFSYQDFLDAIRSGYAQTFKR